MSRALLPLAATAALVAGCLGGGEESSRGPPTVVMPPSTPANPPPPTDPRNADLPRRYVDSAYWSRLWSPARLTDCGRVDRGAPAVVYFSCDPPGTPAAAVRPLTAQEATPRAALRALLRGPTPQERRAGFVSNFGPATATLPFSVRVNRARRYAVVDLDRRILQVEFVFVSVQDVAQIVSTVGQFPGIDWVVLLLGGRPLCDVLEECRGAAGP